MYLENNYYTDSESVEFSVLLWYVFVNIKWGAVCVFVGLKVAFD